MAQALLDFQKSTTGRAVEMEWKRLQFLFGAAVSARMAERTAARLFLSPSRHARPEAENLLLARARAFRVHGLAAWRWGSGPPVLLVHGWEGRGAQLGGFVAPLVDRGFSVVAFDAPAHGMSPGMRASVADFASAVSTLSDRIGSPRAIVAHSLGAIGSLLAVRRGVKADQLVLVAPPSPAQYLGRFRDALAIPEDVLSSMRRRIERRVGAAFDDVEAAHLARDLAIPGLIVHDAGDGEAPVKVSEELAAAWPAATLHVTRGLGHRRIVHDAGVAGRVAAFVAGG